MRASMKSCCSTNRPPAESLQVELAKLKRKALPEDTSSCHAGHGLTARSRFLFLPPPPTRSRHALRHRHR